MLIHMFTHMPYTSFVDSATEGARSNYPAAFPHAAFKVAIIEMLDCAWCFCADPYFSTVERVDTWLWAENEACLLWLLIPHPQLRFK